MLHATIASDCHRAITSQWNEQAAPTRSGRKRSQQTIEENTFFPPGPARPCVPYFFSILYYSPLSSA